MKKTAASAGHKPSTSKQKSKAQTARPESKRKAQALKAAHDARIMEQVKKEQVKKKTVKRAPAAKALSTVKGQDFRSKEAVKRNAALTNGRGKSTPLLVDDKAWTAELNRAPAIEQGANAEGVNREGVSPTEGDREVKHDSLANGAKLTWAPETSFVGFPLMEIALAQWQFWAKTMADYQQACLRLASNSASWPSLTTRPRR
jgi:hypothetical protein